MKTMTKENKELLLKDLSSRLPYRVKVYDIKININNSYMNLCHINGIVGEVFIASGTQCRNAPIEEIKPYLFPLSSLTSKQRTEIGKILTDIQKQYSPYGVVNTEGCDDLFICSVKQSNALINYCLLQHLDINGLIEKGLAEDATGLNIY